jgi:MATE family multidrug resistance protein
MKPSMDPAPTPPRTAPLYPLLAGRAGEPAAPGYGAILRFTLPLVLGLTTLALHTVVDAAFVGRLGTAPLASLGFCTLTYYTGLVLLLGLMRNSIGFTARAFGAGRPEQIGAIVTQYQWLALAGAPLIWAWMQAFPLVARLAHLGPEVEQLARVYLSIRVWDVVFVLTVVLYSSVFQAVGNSRFPMLVTLGTVPLNAVLNYGLVFGHLGLPALGMAGSALATVIAQVAGCAAMVAVAQLGPSRARFGLKLLGRPDWALMRRILAVSTPQGLGDGLEVLAFLAFFVVIGPLGETALAASNIGLQASHLLFMPGIAMGIASASYMGRLLGEGRPEAARRTTYRILALGVGYMGLLGLPLWFLGEAVARIFTDRDDVIAQARLVFKVVAAYQVCDAIGIILRATLGGAGDTRWPTLLLAGSGILVLLPAAFLLARWVEPGVLGAWLGAFLYTAALAAVLGYRFERGPWRTSQATNLG